MLKHMVQYHHTVHRGLEMRCQIFVHRCLEMGCDTLPLRAGVAKPCVWKGSGRLFPACTGAYKTGSNIFAL